MKKETAIRMCARLDEMLLVFEMDEEPDWRELRFMVCGLFGEKLEEVYLQEKTSEGAQSFLRGVKAFLEHDRMEGYRCC